MMSGRTAESMKKTFALALLGALLFAFPARGQRQRARPLAFLHVTVVGGAGAPAKSDMTVVISGGRIRAVGKTGEVKIPAGARVVDATGKFLIPGLWDMHAHVDDTGDYYFPLALANGITGVRDMGSHPDRLREWRALRARGALMPRVVAAGPIVTGMVTDDDPRLLRVAGPADAARAVNALAARGADFVKVFDYLSRDAYLALMRRAARRRVPVAGHLPASVDAAEASRLGQRSVEHTGSALGGLLLDCSTREAELKRELRARLRPPVDVPAVVGYLRRGSPKPWPATRRG
jgi:imidazolonepropionase-like amidohydrolase